MSDPHENPSFGVSIKIPESKKWAGDDVWFTPKGSVAAVRQMILEAFGIDDEGQILFDLAVQAQGMADMASKGSAGLGGTVLKTEPASASSSSAWEQARTDTPAAEAKPPADPLLAKIEAASSMDDLQTLWAENQDQFTPDSAYMEAANKRGREIKEAA